MDDYEVGQFNFLRSLPGNSSMSSWVTAQIAIGVLDFFVFQHTQFLVEATLGMELAQVIGAVYDFFCKN